MQVRANAEQGMSGTGGHNARRTKWSTMLVKQKGPPCMSDTNIYMFITNESMTYATIRYDIERKLDHTIWIF